MLAAIRRHGYVFATVTVAVATLVLLPMRPFLGGEQWGWPYLLVVGLVAGTAGVGPALLSALLGFLIGNFVFIQPYYTLHVASTGDFIHLVAFLVVAVAAGLQTGRLRDSTDAAHKQQLRTAALYRMSAGMTGGIDPTAMARLVDAEVVRVLGAHGARVWMRGDTDAGLVCAPECADEISAASRHTAEKLLAAPGAGASAQQAQGDTFLRLEGTAGVEGVLQLVGVDGLTAEESPFASSVAHVVATFLENRRMQQVTMRASAAEEAEHLRTALVSSVSHELKTPVSSLTATVTDLLGRTEPPPAPQLAESLRAMADDLSRLDRAIGSLLDLSRLEGQAWAPQPQHFEAGELIGAVVSDLPRAQRDRVHYEVPDGVPALRADFVQVSRALGHVVDNALEYSDGPVTIGARPESAGRVSLWVADVGPGIPSAERTRVFEKFFRGASGARRASSTGLGLALAAELVSSNGGDIVVEANQPQGARVVITMNADDERNGV